MDGECVSALRRYELDPQSALQAQKDPTQRPAPPLEVLSPQASAVFARLLKTVELFEEILTWLPARELICAK